MHFRTFALSHYDCNVFDYNLFCKDILMYFNMYYEF